MYSLYKKHLYVNPNYDYIKCASIREYDIKAAGYNILIAAKLLSDEQIVYFENIPKERRNVEIGLLQRDDKELTKAINDGLIHYRKLFFEENEIDENNVISIRRDAIFVTNTRIKKKQFDNIRFVAKNRYSSYYQINKCDFLYSKLNDSLDIKGIDDDFLKYHENYLLKFMKKLFSLNEVSNQAACKYLYDFCDKYRRRKLDIDYYRELDKGIYRLKKLKINGCNIGVEDAFVDEINIKYNYMNYIVPLMGMIY
jgi:hypothetical protein